MQRPEFIEGPYFVSDKPHVPYPASLGCECELCNQGRKVEAAMSDKPTANDVLRAVAYIQDGRQIVENTPSDRWYETTEGADNATEYLSEYAAESYAAGWDTACYAAGNPDVDAAAPDAYSSDEYAAGLLAACALIWGAE